MRSLSKVLLLSLTLAPVAFAQPAPEAPAAPVAAPAAPAPAKVKRISINSKGSLRDVLRELGDKAGVSLVLSGKLDEPAELVLKNVPAEEALEIIATAHDLKVVKKGNIWTLRPMSAVDAAVAPVPPVPPAPPVPGVHGIPDPETLRAQLEQAKQAMQNLSGEDLDRQLEAIEAQREAIEAQREALQEAEEAAREAAEAAREQAHDAAQEARDTAREQAREIREHARRFRFGGPSPGPVVIAEDQTVDEAVSMGGPLTILGHVEGDAVAFGGPIKLGPKSVVDGDVVSFGGPIDRDPGAVVHGDSISMSGAGLNIVGERGSSSRSWKRQQEREERRAEQSRDDSGGLPGFFLSFAMLFAVGFLSMMYMPARMKLLEGEIKREPLKSLAAGVVGALASVPVAIITGLACILIITIPFVLVFWAIVLGGVAMGMAAIANEIGSRIPLMRLRRTRAIVLALGLLVVLLVGQIPVLGPMALTLLSLVSLGAVIRTRLGIRRLGVPQPI